MTTLPNPFVPEIPADEPSRFVLDERAFMEAVEGPPAFLGDPSPEYLAAVTADDLIPVLAVLAGR
jgi:hypothetical protein